MLTVRGWLHNVHMCLHAITDRAKGNYNFKTQIQDCHMGRAENNTD